MWRFRELADQIESFSGREVAKEEAGGVILHGCRSNLGFLYSFILLESIATTPHGVTEPCHGWPDLGCAGISMASTSCMHGAAKLRRGRDDGYPNGQGSI